MPSFRFSAIGALNVVGAFIIVYLAVVLGQTVLHNYQMSQQIDLLKTQIVLLEDQRDALAYNIQYYQTDSFKEREARAKLGLQLPGENVVVLPHTQTAAADKVKTEEAPRKSNLQQWLDFLSGHGRNS